MREDFAELATIKTISPEAIEYYGEETSIHNLLVDEPQNEENYDFVDYCDEEDEYERKLHEEVLSWGVPDTPHNRCIVLAIRDSCKNCDELGCLGKYCTAAENLQKQFERADK
jgi:hypothetical protein